MVRLDVQNAADEFDSDSIDQTGALIQLSPVEHADADHKLQHRDRNLEVVQHQGAFVLFQVSAIIYKASDLLLRLIEINRTLMPRVVSCKLGLVDLVSNGFAGAKVYGGFHFT